MENEIPPTLSTNYPVPKKPEIDPPAPLAPSIAPPVQVSPKQIEKSLSTQKPFLVRLFKTKSSAFLTVLCLGIVLKYIQAVSPIHFLIGIASLSMVFVVVVIALLLTVFGYKKEAGLKITVI